MYYINTLKHECSTAKNYEHNLLDEWSVVDRHRCHVAAKFGVFLNEDHGKLPMLSWIPKLNTLQLSVYNFDFLLYLKTYLLMRW